MEVKEYQQKALNQLKAYLEELDAQREKKAQIDKLITGVRYDVPQQAWEEIEGVKGRGLRPYQSRKNGLGEDLPNICLKVPTGGGKTYLATRAIELINLNYRKRQAGVVLWIVPTSQIYRQTWQALKDKTHYYRQTLDRISGGRTLILEKTDHFGPNQPQEYLIVMLLMLPSANRQNKETLKLFQDSEGFANFFPTESDKTAQNELLQEFPNLDYFGKADSWPGQTVKTSLGNVLRITKPLVIIDEGHKAYSEGAQATIRGFNPCFVLELSATPTPASNVLVTISGQELNREEMIKLDLNIVNKGNRDWKASLLMAYEQIKGLENKAREYQANGGRYIRPICLIQVERTGKDQLDKGYIHAYEVRDYLIKQYGISEVQIAIKSSESDGLENTDLLSPDCPIQYIITKQALQEGWDCAFAYVLVVLTNPGSQRGLTQLVGRVLRQPYAKKTRIKELDESYVFCYGRKSNELLEAIQRGFEDEGLGDLRSYARFAPESTPEAMVAVSYRAEFQKFEGKIYLPRFVIQTGQDYRDLSYSMDILSRIDWRTISLKPLRSLTLGKLAYEDRFIRYGLKKEAYPGVGEKAATSGESVMELDRVFMTRQICDVVPNPWMAYAFAQDTVSLFREGYSEEQITLNLVLIIEQLKKLLIEERDKQAERIFKQLLAAKESLFFLQAIEHYALPRTLMMKASSPKLNRENGDAIQLNLFDRVPDEDLNKLEKAFAIALDKQARLLFWYRNMVGEKYYSVQGWRPNRIFPDFMAGTKSPDDPTDYDKVLVLETKGLHLKGNADTAYKQNIFELCNEIGRQTNWATLCQEFGNKQIQFHVIYEDEWEARINKLLV